VQQVKLEQRVLTAKMVPTELQVKTEVQELLVNQVCLAQLAMQVRVA